MMGRKKKNIEPNPVGRPSEYRQEFCEMLVDHMASGLSFDSFGAISKVSRKTMYSWIDKFQEFKEAKEEGYLQCLLYWERLGRDEVLSISNREDGSRSLNANVYKLNMQNRFGWSDKKDVEHNVKTPHSILLEWIKKNRKEKE